MDALGSKLRKREEPDAELDLLATRVIEAAVEVHRRLGPGFLESVYEEALAIEFKERKIPFIRQPGVEVEYRGVRVGEGRMDFMVGGRLIVELKAVETLAPIHSAQLLSYLRMTGKRLGLLINFNVEVLKRGVKRIINSDLGKA
jgi:GxxExxY protein